MAVTFLNYLELRPPLATDDTPDQTEQHVVSGQCAGATGQRATSLHDWVGVNQSNDVGGGVGLLLHSLPSDWYFVFKIAT